MELIELGTILHMEKGKKPLSQVKEPTEGYLPYVDIKAFEQGVIDNYASPEKSLLCEEGDLLIVGDGSRSGLTGRAIKGVVGSTLFKIYADGVSTDYLRYFIESKYLLLNTKKKGTGTPHLNANILKESKIFVPSLEEQERIVARIEELFSDLDDAVKTLKATQQQLNLYKQAVLKDAFEGKLTFSWRDKHHNENPRDDFERIKRNNEVFKDTSGDENEISLTMPKEWKKVRLGEVFEVQVGATPSRRVPEYWNGNINWVSSGEVHFNNIYSTREQVTEDGILHLSLIHI